MSGSCTARNRQGEPCRRAPILGGTVCWTHGGATRQAKAKAAARLAEMDLEAARAHPDAALDDLLLRVIETPQVTR